MAKFRVGLTRDILDSSRRAGVRRCGAGPPRRRRSPRMGISAGAGTRDHARSCGAIRRAVRQHGAGARQRGRARRSAPARRRAARRRIRFGRRPGDDESRRLVTNTPSSMPRPVATIALTFILALAGKLMLKDRLTRTGRWNERMDNMGSGLTGRTLGVVGAGRIGKELLRMARVFDVALLATDPNVDAIELEYLGARKVDLDTLVAQSDYVVVCCSLDASTRHLIGRSAVRADEADRVLHQRRARTDRRRSRADRRASPQGRSPARRSTCSSRSRSIRQSAARDGQRHRHAALAVLDRRMLSPHGDDGSRQHRRRARRPAAALRRQSGRARASAGARLAAGSGTGSPSARTNLSASRNAAHRAGRSTVVRVQKSDTRMSGVKIRRATWHWRPRRGHTMTSA